MQIYKVVYKLPIKLDILFKYQTNRKNNTNYILHLYYQYRKTYNTVFLYNN